MTSNNDARRSVSGYPLAGRAGRNKFATATICVAVAATLLAAAGGGCDAGTGKVSAKTAEQERKEFLAPTDMSKMPAAARARMNGQPPPSGTDSNPPKP